MKKRVLSLLLACFMVVSTFIISRPIVDVHAVEAEALETWALPYNWHTNLDKDENGWELASKNNGLWRLTSFEDPSDIETIRWDGSSIELASGIDMKKSPQSYVESYNNRVVFVNGVSSTWSSWYVNYNRRYDGKSFDSGNNVDYMEVIPGNNQSSSSHNHPAVVFTAPSDGLYSYTELVEQVVFTYGDAPVTMTATVRKNGLVLNSFTPTEANASKTLDGSVYLEAGDLLAFVFSEDTSNTSLKDTSTYVKLSNVVVKKISNTTTNYSMPLAWVDGCEQGTGSYVVPKKGDWRLTSFSNPSNINSLVWNGSNQPWMNNSQNASTTSFYVNGTAKWANGTIFNKGVEGEYILAIPYGKYGRTSGNADTNISGSNPTALFTAPVSGEYAYSEIMRGVTMTDVNGTPVTVTATVRKNGEVLDTVVISADEPYACNAGTVTLEAGDFLMFVFVLDQTDARIKDHTDFIRLYAADVALIAAAPTYENSVELPIIFDGTSFTDNYGMVELMGYDCTTGAPYKDGIAIDTYDGKWYVYEPDGKSTYYGNAAKDNYLWGGNLSTGVITSVGGDFKLAGIGSTLVFTAPYDGIFKFESTMTSAWPASQNGAWSEYVIQKADGTVLDTDNNIDKGNNYGTNSNATTVSATATLTKGEQVYIIRRPTGNGNVNVSCGGGATITITDLEHTCSSETVKHITAVTPGCEDGNIEYYICSCGTKYADADATTEVIGDVVLPGTGHADSNEWGQSATQHWMYCANGCGELRVEKTNHTWENGVCSVCEYECKHENANVANCVSASVCPVCSVELAPINPNNHALPNSVHANGDGTHRHVRVCCDASSVVTEDCAYDENGICVECGFDGSTLIKIENNINNAFDNAFNSGNNNVTATGPSAGALDDYKVVESATPVAGAQYVLFNLYANLTTKDVYLRHHFVVTDANVQITVNGNPVTEKSGDNVYYYDSTPVLGKYDVADTIVITDGTNTATYSVSLYSYIKSVLYDEDGLSYDDKGEETVAITAAHKDLLKALYDANEEAKKVEPVYVAMANQTKNQIQIYDLNAGNLNTPVWTYDITVGGVSGFRLRKYNGDTVLLVTVGTKAEMYNITTGQRVWYTTNTPDNSHCIEILPNGIIAVGGTVGHDVHFYNLNGNDPTEILYEHPLNNAHGLLWDPDNNVLWATGHIYLQALNVTLNAGGTVTVEINEEITAPNTPEPSTHDLQPYFGNKDLILVSTSNYIFVYNKVTKTYTELVKEGHIKGVSVLENGDILYIYPDGLVELWNSTWINKVDVETGEITEIHSNQGRFYKLLVCNTNYQ